MIKMRKKKDKRQHQAMKRWIKGRMVLLLKHEMPDRGTVLCPAFSKEVFFYWLNIGLVSLRKFYRE